MEGRTNVAVAPPPPPLKTEAGYHPRERKRVVAFLFGCMFTTQLFVNYDSGAIPSVLDDIKREFTLSDVMLGLLGALPYIGLIVASPFIGRYLQIISQKKLLLICIGLNLGSAILLAVSVDAWLLFLSRFLLGLTQSGFCIYVPVWVDEFAPEKQLTMWMGLIQGATVFGVMLGYLVTGYIRPWRMSITVECGVLFALWVAFIFTPSQFINLYQPPKSAGPVAALQSETADGKTLHLSGSKSDEEATASGESSAPPVAAPRSSIDRLALAQSPTALLQGAASPQALPYTPMPIDVLHLAGGAMLWNSEVPAGKKGGGGGVAVSAPTKEIQENTSTETEVQMIPAPLELRSDTIEETFYQHRTAGNGVHPNTSGHSATGVVLFGATPRKLAAFQRIQSIRLSADKQQKALHDIERQDDAQRLQASASLSPSSSTITNSGHQHIHQPPDSSRQIHSALSRSFLSRTGTTPRNTLRSEVERQMSVGLPQSSIGERPTSAASYGGAVADDRKGFFGRAPTFLTPSPAGAVLESLEMAAYFDHPLILRKQKAGTSVTAIDRKLPETIEEGMEDERKEMQLEALISSASLMQHEGVWSQIKYLVCNQVYIWTVVTLCALIYVVTAIQYWSTKYFIEAKNAEPNYVRAVFSATAATAPTLGVLLGGYVVDKLGGYRSKKGMFRALTMCLCSGILASVAGIVGSFLDSFPAIIGMVWILLFFGGAILPPATGILIASVDPKSRAFASGFSMFIYNIFGYALGTFLPGAFMSALGLDAGMKFVFFWSLFGVAGMSMAILSAWKESLLPESADEEELAAARSAPTYASALGSGSLIPATASMAALRNSADTDSLLSQKEMPICAISE